MTVEIPPLRRHLQDLETRLEGLRRYL